MVRLKHYDNLGTARFVTFSCYHHQRILIGDETIMPFIDELQSARAKYDLAILGYVIMPDHVHLVIYPRREVKLGRVIGEIKSRSAPKIIRVLEKDDPMIMVKLTAYRNGERRRAVWQRRCYDHNCRTPAVAREKINYCHMNPVHAGLANNPANWKWSSYNWYNGDRDVPLEIDGIEL